MCSMTWLYDSHIHLSDTEYEHDIPLIMNCMKRLCIKACCVSMDYSSSIKTLELGKQSDLVLPFIGIHPEKAQDDTESVFKLIDENNEKISGIGEIGLDSTYTNSDEEFGKQEEVFKTQLSYAEKFGKPVSIHSRKTLDQDKILVETDGPVRFSRCFENKTAQIDFIPSIVFCASKVLHVNYDELCDVIEQNSKRFLML